MSRGRRRALRKVRHVPLLQQPAGMRHILTDLPGHQRSPAAPLHGLAQRIAPFVQVRPSGSGETARMRRLWLTREGRLGAGEQFGTCCYDTPRGIAPCAHILGARNLLAAHPLRISRVSATETWCTPTIPTSRAARTLSTLSSTNATSTAPTCSRLSASAKIAGSGFARPR